MSHTRRYYERMSDSQLLYQMSHASYSSDRALAAQVYNARMAASTTANQNVVNILNNNLRMPNTALVTDQIRDIVNEHNNTLIQRITDLKREMDQQHRDYERRIKQANDANHAQIRRVMAAAEEREHQLQITHAQDMQQVRHDMQQLEAATHRRIEQAMDTVSTSLNQRIKQVQDELTIELNAQQEQINSLHAGFTALTDAMATLNEQRQANLTHATEYLNAARAVREAADDFNLSNNHSWCGNMRNALINLERRLEEDINNGRDQIAFNNGRDLFENAMQYRANVVAEERQWQLELSAARDAAALTQDVINQSRTVEMPSEDTYGNPFTETIDVDYWTCGDLSRIEANHALLQEQLKDPHLTHEEISDLQALAENYREQVTRATTYALQARQISYDREDMLQTAANTIADTTGTIHRDWCEFYNGDERLGRRLYLRSDAGERIVLTVEPEVIGDQIRNTCRMEVLSFGASIHDLASAGMMTDAIIHSLRGTDLQVSDSTCSDGNDGPVDVAAPDHGQSQETPWKSPTDPAIIREHIEQQRPIHAQIPNAAARAQNRIPNIRRARH